MYSNQRTLRCPAEPTGSPTGPGRQTSAAASFNGELMHKTRRAPRENFVPEENRLPKRDAPRERFVASRGAPPPRRGRGQLLALSRSSGPALDLDGLCASQPGAGLRPVKPIRPKT